MDIAVVGVGASVTLSESGGEFVSARVALGAVAPTPLLAEQAGDALAGQPVSDDVIAQAVNFAQAAAKPIDDMRGTAAFRRHVTGVLTRRVIEEAVRRARTGRVESRLPH